MFPYKPAQLSMNEDDAGQQQDDESRLRQHTYFPAANSNPPATSNTVMSQTMASPAGNPLPPGSPEPWDGAVRDADNGVCQEDDSDGYT